MWQTTMSEPWCVATQHVKLNLSQRRRDLFPPDNFGILERQGKVYTEMFRMPPRSRYRP